MSVPPGSPVSRPTGVFSSPPLCLDDPPTSRDREHQQAGIRGQSYDIWFDYEGVPLRWHHPLGVLCDVLVGREASPALVARSPRRIHPRRRGPSRGSIARVCEERFFSGGVDAPWMERVDQ